MQSPLERIDADIKNAMMAKDPLKLNTARMLKSALKYYQIEKKLNSLAESDLIAVVHREIKKRQDAAESFRQASREDLRQKEEAEIALLKPYLPPGLTAAELEALVKSCIEEIGATSKNQLGQVMKLAIAKAAGRADGKSINEIASRLLA